jgi:hypothetical protein
MLRFLTPFPSSNPFTVTKSVQFDGVSNYLAAVKAGITGSISFGGWFKWTSTGDQHLFTQWHPASSERAWAIRAGNVSAGNLEFLISQTGTGVGKQYRLTGPYNDGVWRLICATMDVGSNTFTIYVNGSSQVPTIVTNNSVTAVFNDPNSLGFGAIVVTPGSSANSFYGGLANNVFIYSGVLSAGDVTNIYNSGTPVNLLTLSTSATLARWYQLGNGPGDSVLSGFHDNATPADTATAYNSPTIANDAP